MQLQNINEAFPPWSVMTFVDILLPLLAGIGTIIVIKKWKALKEAQATSGILLILVGIWIGTSLYIADLFLMTLLPHVIGMAEAMRMLHTRFSWYTNSASAALVVVGLVLMVWRLLRQLEALEVNSRAHAESEDLLESVFQNVPVGLLIKDADNIVERANNTYLNWYGLNSVELVGRRGHVIKNFQSVEDVEVMSDQELQVMRTGKTQIRQVERELVDGQRHILKITKFPVHDKHGKITKVGSVSVDLTELIEAKQGAEEARTEADLANRAKSAFLANMSHELRTPLNAIIGFSETMLTQIFGPIGSEKYNEYAKAIHQSGHHLLDLVNDILDMAKIESEEMELSLEPFELREIVAGAFQIVQPIADRNHVELVKQLPDALPVVTGYKRAMSQILLNLLSNAVKFTPEGGPVVVSATASRDDLTLCVQDNGIGIAANDIPNITKPFNQGSRKRAYNAGEGTGLGLSIVVALVEQHHGRLDIRSEVGKGTRVSVFLPGVLQNVRRLSSG
jgi:PAS domain S-box-containing protein